MVVALLFSCNKAFDHSGHTRIGMIENYSKHNRDPNWGIALMFKYGFQPDGFRVCNNYYYDKIICIYENTTTIHYPTKTRRVIFVEADGSVFRLNDSEISMLKDGVRFQGRKFRSDGWGEAGVTIE
jgi:hypothetical protein